MSYRQYVDKGKETDLSSIVVPSEAVNVLYNRNQTIGSAFVNRDSTGIMAEINLNEIPSNAELYPVIIVQHNRLVSISLNPERNADRTIKAIQFVTSDVIEKEIAKDVLSGFETFGSAILSEEE